MLSSEDWIKDLTRSNKAFLAVVWPSIKAKCGGGEIKPVEVIRDNEIARDLDVLAGIDIWQTITGIGCRGIASRVQFGSTAWDTFTIRYSRESGAKTEYQKRLEAINSSRGIIYPYLMCHAYISMDDQLLSCGLARTVDIFDAIPHDAIRTKTTSNASFIPVSFSSVKDCFVVKPSSCGVAS